VGLARSPERSVGWSKGPVPRPLRGGGAGPEGLYPSPRLALPISLGAEKSNSVLGFSMPIPKLFGRQQQAVPSTCATPIRDGPGLPVMARLRLPHAYSEHLGRSQTYLRRSVARAVFWQPGSLGWEGAIGAGLALRRAPNWPAESRKSREQSRIVSSSEARPPCCGAGCNARPVAEGAVSIVSGSGFVAGPQLANATTGSGAGSRSLLWALATLGATPLKGGLVITVAEASSGSRPGGQVHRLLRTAFSPPQLLENSAPFFIQLQTTRCLAGAGQRFSGWRRGPTLSGRAAGFTSARWVQTESRPER